METKPRIHVLGSINVDFVIETKTLPRAGETVGNGTFSTVPGGKGANQALAAQRLGAAVSMHGCVGDDAFAALALANLKDAGVNLGGVERTSKAATGAAFINVSEDGENQIAVAGGANLFCAPANLPKNGDALISQFEVPTEVIARTVSASDIFFCLNTAPVIPVERSLLERADLLVLNETEHEFYASQIEGLPGLVAKTLGAAGAILFRNGEEVARSPVPDIAVKDTTGAGDCFTGALTSALCQKMPEERALRFACAAGALATTKLGAQSASPSFAEVEALL